MQVHQKHHSWQRVPKPPVLWRPPLYCLLPIFKIFFQPPPPPLLLLSLLPCFFGWMCGRATSSVLFYLMTYICQTLVPDTPCYEFYARKRQVYYRFDNDMGFASILTCITHTNTDTQYTQRPIDSHIKYIFLPSTMCSKQLSVWHWIHNSLISKIFYIEVNIFALQKLFTCRSHNTE